jgi:hypothetical protein
MERAEQAIHGGRGRSWFERIPTFPDDLDLSVILGMITG